MPNENVYLFVVPPEITLKLHPKNWRHKFINVLIIILSIYFEFQLPNLVRLESKDYFYKNSSHYNYLKNGINFVRQYLINDGQLSRDGISNNGNSIGRVSIQFERTETSAGCVSLCTCFMKSGIELGVVWQKGIRWFLLAFTQQNVIKNYKSPFLSTNLHFYIIIF